MPNLTPTETELAEATSAALECLAWTTPADAAAEADAELPEFLDDWDVEWADNARHTLAEEVTEFILDNLDDLTGLDYSQIGHDFILTRNRHGAGFWDRGLGERGERLADAARAYGQVDPVILAAQPDCHGHGTFRLDIE